MKKTRITKDTLNASLSQLDTKYKDDKTLAERLLSDKLSSIYCVELLQYLEEHKLINVHDQLVYALLRIVACKTKNEKVPDWIIEQIATNKNAYAIDTNKDRSPLRDLFLRNMSNLNVSDENVLERIYNTMNIKSLHNSHKAELIAYHIANSKSISTRIKKEIQTLPANRCGVISTLILNNDAVKTLLNEKDNSFLKFIVEKMPYQTLHSILNSYATTKVKGTRLELIYRGIGRNIPNKHTSLELVNLISDLYKNNQTQINIIRDVSITKSRKFTLEQNTFEICLEAAQLPDSKLGYKKMSPRMRDIIKYKTTERISTQSDFLNKNKEIYDVYSELFGKDAMLLLSKQIKSGANWLLLTEQLDKNHKWKTEPGYEFLLKYINNILLDDNFSTGSLTVLDQNVTDAHIIAAGLDLATYSLHISLGLNKANALKETAKSSALDLNSDEEIELPDFDL